MRQHHPQHYRSLYLPLGMVAGAVLGLCYYCLAPIDPVSERDAVVLGRAGPRGARSYQDALRDGKITRPELYQLREAAGEDIDAYYGLHRTTPD